MSDELLPEPEASAALVPPPRTPPTALATSAPLPPIRRSDDDDRLAPRGLLRLVDSALDALDSLGDRVASLIGVR
jgi:hypothetical protein